MIESAETQYNTTTTIIVAHTRMFNGTTHACVNYNIITSQLHHTCIPYNYSMATLMPAAQGSPQRGFSLSSIENNIYICTITQPI